MARGDWLKRRSTSDLLVLMIAATICCSVVVATAVIGILSFAQPEKNHSAASVALADALQLLTGLLAGFIAGRTTERSVNKDSHEHPEQDHE